MAWDDAPPTEEELKGSTKSWDSEPPSEEELAASPKEDVSTDDNIPSMDAFHAFLAKYAGQVPIAGSYIPEAAASLKAKLKGYEIGSPEYIADRDRNYKILQKAEEENPLSSMAGTGAGFVSSIGAFPYSIMKKAGPALKGLENVGQIALQTALQNPGHEEGKYNPAQIEERGQMLQNASQDPLTLSLTAISALAPAIASKYENMKGENLSTRTVGIKKNDFRALKESGELKGDVSKEIKNYGEYAKDSEIVRPWSSLDQLSQRVSDRLKDVGRRIGEIRNRAEKLPAWQKLQQLLESSPGEHKSFIPENVKMRIFEKIDNEIPDPIDANKVKSIVGERLDALQQKAGYNEVFNEGIVHNVNGIPVQGKLEKVPRKIPLSKLTELKAGWQEFLKPGKLTPDSISERAFKYLKDAANESISSEIKLMDKALSGNDLALHRQLSKEYQMLNMMEKSVTDKMHSVANKSFGMHSLNPLESSMITSTLANTPENIIPNIIKQLQFNKTNMDYEQLKNEKENQQDESLGPQSLNQMPRQTTVANIAAEMGVNPEIALQNIKNDIENNDRMSNMDKARRLSMMGKRGIVLLS